MLKTIDISARTPMSIRRSVALLDIQALNFSNEHSFARVVRIADGRRLQAIANLLVRQRSKLKQQPAQQITAGQLLKPANTFARHSLGRLGRIH